MAKENTNPVVQSPRRLQDGGEIVMYRPDDTVQLEVRVDDDSVWLTQAQMSLLFGTTRANVTLHIGNIFKEQELEKNSVCKDFLQTAADGKSYHTNFYNLDVIISVGYRIKSLNGTRFRQWATSVLREYTLRGYAISHRLQEMEQRIDSRLMAQHDEIRQLQAAQAKQQEQLDFFVRTSLPPVEQIFFEGHFFEARVLLERLVKSANKRVIVIDAYVDAATMEMLDVRKKGVDAAIYSGRDLTKLRDLHNATAGVEPIGTFIWRKQSHDRWLVIDDKLYHCGHSLKDMGQRLSAIMLMGTPPETILKEVQ